MLQSEILMRFPCVLYGKTVGLSSINYPRQELFSKQSKLMEFIPSNHVRLVIGCNFILCIQSFTIDKHCACSASTSSNRSSNERPVGGTLLVWEDHQDSNSGESAPLVLYEY